MSIPFLVFIYNYDCLSNSDRRENRREHFKYNRQKIYGLLVFN
uniref:Uncharacterized protein n=1 Tax=Siphoviridae sp. ctZHD14 TaxID=2827891 RepID=A0A8S5SXM2_9CAUD|nr:MAG TPA: hypothetical protein [Siphoviridae sp. ctZHD14]